MYAPVLALCVVVELALDHVDHDLVADKTTLVHDLLGLLSEVGLLRDLGPQHVSSGLFGEFISGKGLCCARTNFYSPGGKRSTFP
jgi:hypothetical protein